MELCNRGASLTLYLIEATAIHIHPAGEVLTVACVCVAVLCHARPGSWKLSIDPSDGSLQRTLVPTTGKVDSLFRPAKCVTLT